MTADISVERGNRAIRALVFEVDAGDEVGRRRRVFAVSDVVGFTDVVLSKQVRW